MRAIAILLVAAACGDNFGGTGTPEEVATGADEGQHVVATGVVHTVTFESTQNVARRIELEEHAGDIQWILESDAEELRGLTHSFDEAGADYPRTGDRYVLIRTARPAGVSQDEPGFTPGALAAAWGLGIHISAADTALALPEIGTTIKVTGTFHLVVWNGREVKVPVVDDATIEVVADAAAFADAGDACALDQECNSRLVCDRTSLTCVPPPREIYWGDPWRDVNGACDTDADCPLGQICDQTHVLQTTGPYALHYFIAADAGRHLCVLAPGATVASMCPHVYTMRDLAGARFVAGKEVCVRGTLLSPVPAEDGDTHDQMRVDEPIPYPTADIAYQLFGATTENGPIYKDPSLPGGGVTDPVAGQDVIAVGTYRYDPDHGWHEVHPVKAYLTP